MGNQVSALIVHYLASLPPRETGAGGLRQSRHRQSKRKKKLESVLSFLFILKKKACFQEVIMSTLKGASDRGP